MNETFPKTAKSDTQPTMHPRTPGTESVLHRLKGRQVSQVRLESGRQISIQFADGVMLAISADPDGLAVRLTGTPSRSREDSQRPTRRQLEYLAFISRYMHRFGRAPAESDIQRHFLVCAPTVNQMMHMLERRGFIKRQPGVPRSARLCLDVSLLNSD